MNDVQSIEISSSSGKYRVDFIDGHFRELSSCQENSVRYVVDSFFKDSHLLEDSSCFFVSATEKNKSLATVANIADFLLSTGATRTSHLIAVGGGIVQDISTLVAALYMRGISWTYYPTTLLGMVDSCIGGKSSINTNGGKNVIGNIYPPRSIVIDTTFVPTLSRLDVLAGMSEALKIGFCGGNDSFRRISSLLENLQLVDPQQLIYSTLKIKQGFIEEDEFDTGVRQLLNFGHTFGHAIEVGSNFGVPHGIAVAMGMKCAIQFNHFLGYSTSQTSDGLLKYCDLISKEALSLCPTFQLDVDKCLQAFEHDKKHTSDMYRVILPTQTSVARLEVERSSTTSATIKSVFEDLAG